MFPRLAAAPVLAAAVALAGCGGGGGTGHDSPEAAVRGMVGALQSGDISAACDWVAPSQRTSCTQSLAAARALGPGVSFRVDDFAITATDTDPANADRATVHVKGSFHLCDNGQCVNSAALLASQGADSVTVVREQGQWWVAGLGGDVGTGAAPPAVGSSSGTDTGGTGTDTGSGVTTESSGPSGSPGAEGGTPLPGGIPSSP